MCSSMPGSGRRSRRLRCTPRLRPLATSPAPCRACFTQVAQLELVLGPQLLVKMLHAQIEIAIPIQSQNLLHHRQRDSLGGRLSPPPVEQPVIAKLFQSLSPAAHRPLTDADDLGCLPPGDLFVAS